MYKDYKYYDVTPIDHTKNPDYLKDEVEKYNRTFMERLPRYFKLALDDLRANRDTPVTQVCPRCRERILHPVTEKNPVSQYYTDIHICEQCAQKEKDLDLMNAPGRAQWWEFIHDGERPRIFKSVPHEEAMQFIEEEHIWILQAAFERQERGVKIDENARLALQRACWGANISLSNGKIDYVRYDVSDGLVYVRFRIYDGEVQYSIKYASPNRDEADAKNW